MRVSLLVALGIIIPFFTSSFHMTSAQTLTITSLTPRTNNIQLYWSYPSSLQSTTRLFEIRASYLGPCNVTLPVVRRLFSPSTRTTTISGLQEFSLYSVRISANRTSWLYATAYAYRNTITLAARPSAAVRNVRAVSVGFNYVVVTWDPIPCLLQNSAIVDYRLVHYINGTIKSPIRTISTDGMTINCTLCNMSNTTYGLSVVPTYRVSGSSTLLEGLASTRVNITIPPQGLNIIRVATATTRVLVYWTFNSHLQSDVSFIEVSASYLGPCQNVTVPLRKNVVSPQTRSSLVSGLEEFSQYRVTVTANLNDVLTNFSDTMNFTTLATRPSGIVQNLRAISIGLRHIRVTWDPMPCLDQNTVIVDFRLALYINLVRQQDYRYVSQDRTTALCTRCTMPDTSYGLAVYSTYRMPSSSLLFTGPFSAIITVRTSSEISISTVVPSTTTIVFNWTYSTNLESSTEEFVITASYIGPCENADVPTRTVRITDVSSRRVTIEGVEEFSQYRLNITAVRTGSGAVNSTASTNTTTLGARPASTVEDIQVVTMDIWHIEFRWNPVPCLEQNNELIDYHVKIFIDNTLNFTEVSNSQVTYNCTRCNTPNTTYGIVVFPTYRVPSSGSIAPGPQSPIFYAMTNPSCIPDDVQLIGGNSSLEGRVEVCQRDHRWGTVCDDLWDMFDANVVCRQLGYSPEGALVTRGAEFGEGTGRVSLSEVDCDGTEAHLVQCSFITTHFCTHSQDAGVRCLPPSPTEASTGTPTETPNSTRSIPVTSLLAQTADPIGAAAPLSLWQIIVIVIGGLILVSFVLICLIVVCCAKKRKKNKKNRKAKMMRRISNDKTGLLDLEMSFLERQNTQKKMLIEESRKKLVASQMDDLVIPNSHLRLMDVIGEGEFGMVYKAHYIAGGRERKVSTVSVISGKNDYYNTPNLVAVKVQKDPSQFEELIQECKWMKDFKHPNVLTLLGICIDAGPSPYVVMPFMTHGSLKTYLKDNKSGLTLSEESSYDDVNSVCKRLSDMCLQVCKGMEYLAAKKVVHRDLAARNCMIDSSWMIKVADFGLSEDTSGKNYFRQEETSGLKLPIKWMALESVEEGIFTEKTDVWSFGVTMWEVFSVGQSPYRDMHPIAVLNYLKTDQRLEKPANTACDDHIFSIMEQCWMHDPEERPTFSQLCVSLSEVLESMSDYMEVMTFGKN